MPAKLKERVFIRHAYRRHQNRVLLSLPSLAPAGTCAISPAATLHSILTLSFEAEDTLVSWSNSPPIG
jgi:hypothetical protein